MTHDEWKALWCPEFRRRLEMMAAGVEPSPNIYSAFMDEMRLQIIRAFAMQPPAARAAWEPLDALVRARRQSK